MKIILNIWILLVILLHGAYPHAELHDSTQLKVESQPIAKLPSIISIFVETNSVCNHLENFAANDIFYTFVVSRYEFSNYVEITNALLPVSHHTTLDSHESKQRNRAPPAA